MNDNVIRADGMVVIDGIRYKPHEAPRSFAVAPTHKAVLAPTDPAGITSVDDDDVEVAPVGTGTVEVDEKNQLLEQLEAAGAPNMATLRRYGVARLQAELDKLTDG